MGETDVGAAAPVTGVPKHVRVREYVRSLLDGAEPGTPTPSERELVQRFGVARMTVRQALDALVAEGLLERVPGRGTFVAEARTGLTAALLGFTEEMRRRGARPSSRTLLLRLEAAGPGVARALELEQGAPVVHWQRLRCADDHPICVQDVYLPVGVVPHLVERRDGTGTEPPPDSLYEDLTRRGLPPTWGEDNVEGGLATEAEAFRLQTATRDPVLRIARRALSDRRPVEVSRSTYPAERYAVWVPMSRQGAVPGA
ncbi:MAG: Predicted transcriptional regulator of N-Acetylglucosamine utilization, GntR family [uncultured Nocardioidaceae bacterium]|uniref:Predicted transcriptional regulator of N-Acetylglucosamine utilization, GntR family n=1 Tax=uncultured Nocardioidaceae bacterium TaxID=253824 RepID=A0A6J4L0Q6_9ACTN|nr:MAG: Predicted transcriptional regulator of N-Acetylglucosamine utilization, GntR family [uncultured Nocardioidaceae bacterium]